MNRRNFIGYLGLATFFAGLNTKLFASSKDTLKILLVSGWQSVNIGDIAHTIGLIETFKKYLPTAKLALWKVKPDKIVEDMIKSHFPDVEIITTQINSKGKLSDANFEKLANECDLLVHASGPFVVAQRHINMWRKYTKKPYGIFGVTIDRMDDKLRDILQNAAFVFTRETASLENLREWKIDKTKCAFVPDATFSFDVRDEKKAKIFFDNNKVKLLEKKFVCFIPRLRYTPYWESGKTTQKPEEIERRKKVNESREPIDSAKMRDAIEWLFRNTDYNVLLCPEMTYQVKLCEEKFYNPLKKKYGNRLVLRDYWLPDEAAAVYAKAAAVVSFEFHSPILALRQNTPALYLRQPEDTIKGQMYYDISLTKWVFEIDNCDSTKIISVLSDIIKKPKIAKEYLDKANKNADDLLKKGTEIAAQKPKDRRKLSGDKQGGSAATRRPPTLRSASNATRFSIKKSESSKSEPRYKG